MIIARSSAVIAVIINGPKAQVRMLKKEEGDYGMVTISCIRMYTHTLFRLLTLMKILMQTRKHRFQHKTARAHTHTHTDK